MGSKLLLTIQSSVSLVNII